MPRLLDNVCSELQRLPGIGRRTALRLAMHILKMDPEAADSLSESIKRFRHEIRYCASCNNLSDSDICPICSDTRRDHSTICVVEDPRDVIAIERTHEYNGLYHVLHGVISPMNDINPEDICIKELLLRLGDDTVKEVIMATNPTVEGEATSMYISRLIKPLGVNVSRLAYGVPVGADLEYADEFTLIRALEGRKEL